MDLWDNRNIPSTSDSSSCIARKHQDEDPICWVDAGAGLVYRLVCNDDWHKVLAIRHPS